MRFAPAHIWDMWQTGGPFVGEDGAPHGRVTVETDWELHTSSGVTGNHPSDKLPIRWWRNCEEDPTETEVPNVKSISVDQSLDADAATCTIVLYNQWHQANTSTATPRELGYPGYLTATRGQSPEAQSRWGHAANEWEGVLVPNALLRTYEGYGGRDLSIASAVSQGYLAMSGVWLIDEVRVQSTGEMEIKCRDMAKLLIEQSYYPPLVPRIFYTDKYRRWEYDSETVETITTGEHVEQQPGDRRSNFSLTGNQAWYPPNGIVHGHNPTDAFDGRTDTFWLSVGNSSPSAPYAVEYLEIECAGEWVNAVYVHPWAGNYQMYISVMEDGVWQGASAIPYDAGGTGLYGSGTYAAGINYVASAGVPWEEAREYCLPRPYRAQKIRITFTNLARSAWGPYLYRAGVREFRSRWVTRCPTVLAGGSTTTSTQEVKKDGNYRDYSDIVRDLLLWSGFWCFTTLTGSIFKVEARGGGSVAWSSQVAPNLARYAHDHDDESIWRTQDNVAASAVEWIEFNNTGETDKVVIRPWGGGYSVYVSVWVDNAWEGAGSAPGGGPPYVASATNLAADTDTAIPFGDTYDATMIRLTFTNLRDAGGGVYNCGIREYEAEQTVELVAGDRPVVYGNIESTNAWSDEDLPVDMFDKESSIVDIINRLKQVVGYIFYVDGEGGVHWEAPNWWQPGNFDDIEGFHSSFIPDVDERIQLTNYQTLAHDRTAVSEIIITNYQPIAGAEGTVTTVFRSPTASMLRGMVKPLMAPMEHFADKGEQEIMAELVALHLWLKTRLGQVTCVGNPLITPNDQIRVWERLTGDTYVHYVRSVSRQLDLDAGTYTMQLTTHWLGEKPTNWAIDIGNGGAEDSFVISKRLRDWIMAQPSRILTHAGFPAGTASVAWMPYTGQGG